MTVTKTMQRLTIVIHQWPVCIVCNNPEMYLVDWMIGDDEEEDDDYDDDDEEEEEEEAFQLLEYQIW